MLVEQTQECLPLTSVHGLMLGLFWDISSFPPKNEIMFSYLLRSKGLWWQLNTLLDHIQMPATLVPTSDFQALLSFLWSCPSLLLSFLSISPQQGL